ncbi:MAG: class I SAM-dependent methyltransferase [Kofleriaceae bacterium]|nr:class I SAM-dependent methyltransferase [Kofleriaceae bacterium]
MADVNNRNIDQGDALPRNHKVMLELDAKGLGLEIGPSFNPVAPKRAGYKVHILDHLDADGLRKKYPHLKPENIEEVDFVWHGEPLAELIGQTGVYDWIVASHVIEHVPDLITFLQQCAQLLKPTGRLSLVVPDKRYCFDLYSPESSTGQILDAYHAKSRRPTPGQIFDHYANAVNRDGSIAWEPSSTGKIALHHDPGEAKKMWLQAQASDEYVDVHNWRFTPDNFRLLITDLENLGLLPIGIIREFGTVGCEFFVTLGKHETGWTAPDRYPMLREAATPQPALGQPSQSAPKARKPEPTGYALAKRTGYRAWKKIQRRFTKTMKH